MLKGLLAFDATLGINLGPRSPTSYMGLLYRLAGEFNGAQGAQIFPEGGIPKLIETLYKSSRIAGVEFILKNADQILREKFGDDINIKKFERSKGWLAKKLGSESNAEQVISILEEN